MHGRILMKNQKPRLKNKFHHVPVKVKSLYSLLNQKTKKKSHHFIICSKGDYNNIRERKNKMKGSIVCSRCALPESLL